MIPQGKPLAIICLVSIFLNLLVVACSIGTEMPLETALPVRRTPSPSRVLASPSSTATQTLTPSKAEPTLKAASPTIMPTRQPFEMCSPLKLETISELFEIVSDPYNPPPVNRSEERHHGVDFAHYERKGMKSIEGEVVQAILKGRVASVIVDRLPYGNMVILETTAAQLPAELAQEVGLHPGSSLYVLYAHLAERPEVTLREEVICGQQLGMVGKTGYNIVNPHLHLEIRIGPPGAIFTEMAFYTTTATQDEMDSYLRWRTSGEFQHRNPMVFFAAFLDWSLLYQVEN